MSAPVHATSERDPRPVAASASSMTKVARGGTLNMVGAGVSAAANFGLALVVTHGASRSEAGIFFSATAMFLLATSLGQLGTNTGLVYFLSQARAHGSIDEARRYIRIALVPVMTVAVVMAAVLLVFARPVAELVGGGDADRLGSYVRVLAIFVPAAGLANLCYSATRGLGTMRASAFLDQMARPLLQVVLVAVALAASGSHLAGAAWGAPYLPVAILAWLAWIRLSRRPNRQLASSQPASARAFWRFSAPRALASVAQVAMQRLDVVLVAAMAGVVQAAVYAAASRFLSLGQMAGGAVSQAVQPHLGHALARKDVPEAVHLYRTSTAWLVLVAWPLYLVLIMFTSRILSVFGTSYQAGSSVLGLLCLSMLVATGCGMVDMVLMMAGRTSWNLYNVLLAFGVNLGLDLWLIPRMGIMGAAIGWAAAILVANLMPLLQVVSRLRMHPFGRATLTAMGMSAVCFGALPAGVRLLAGEGWVPFLAATAGGLLCYAGLLYLFRGTLELSALRAVRRSRRSDKAPAEQAGVG